MGAEGGRSVVCLLFVNNTQITHDAGSAVHYATASDSQSVIEERRALIVYV